MIKEENIQKALYSGKLEIGNSELFCYVLDDGTRLLSATSVFTAFGRSRKGRRSEKDKSYIRVGGEQTELPPFLPANLIKSQENNQNKLYFNEISSILGWAEEIHFYDGGVKKTGYKSQLLIEICNLYINARKYNSLLQSQVEASRCAEVLLQAFAKVGLDGLIDEATGYNKDPKYEGLRILLNQYIAEGLQKWTKTFPDKFFEKLDKLYLNEKTASRNRPMYYGHFINSYIYEPIEKGFVKQELDKLNVKDDGTRKAIFHQWLTEKGKHELILQIGQVMGLMQASTTLRKFRDSFERLDKPSLLTDEQWEQYWTEK